MMNRREFWKSLYPRAAAVTLPAAMLTTLLDRQHAQAQRGPVDLDTQRYEDLTAAEMVSMTVGIQLFDTNPHRGRRVMELSLDLEHLIAVVPLDPRQIGQEQLDRIRLFRDQLDALTGTKVLLHILRDFPSDKMPPADARPPAERPPEKRGAYMSPTGHPTRFASRP